MVLGLARYGLETIAVGIAHESGVVVGTISLADAWRPVVDSAVVPTTYVPTVSTTVVPTTTYVPTTVVSPVTTTYVPTVTTVAPAVVEVRRGLLGRRRVYLYGY